MKKSLMLYLLSLVLIPVLVVSTFYNMLLKYENKIDDSNIENNILEDETKKNNLESDITIKINNNNNIEELSLEEYIVGVVAGEMPASFNLEALKAQAVASRTYAMYKILNYDNVYDVETTTDDQVYISIDDMHDKWGSDFDIYYNKIKEAVISTKNLVMRKDNKIFKSFYFSMSNGYTEDSITVFGENISSSVESPWDNETLNKFKVTTEFTEEELCKKLNLSNSIDQIEILNIDNTNRVEKIKVNDKTYTGIEFRKLLSLRSTDFTITKENNIYKITTKGYGHGVGMSQYGANGMANSDYKYEDILEYYYQNIEITTI